MAEKSKTHTIRVNRISYAYRDIEINSETPITERKAEDMALEMAGDCIFDESDAEYEIDGVRKDPPSDAQINAALKHIFLIGLNPERRAVLRELLESCTGNQLSNFNKQINRVSKKK